MAFYLERCSVKYNHASSAGSPVSSNFDLLIIILECQISMLHMCKNIFLFLVYDLIQKFRCDVRDLDFIMAPPYMEYHLTEYGPNP